MTQHDQARQVTLRLRRDGATRFIATMKMVADFHGYAGGDEDPNLSIAAETEIRYFGLIVVKGNLNPKPTTKTKALAVAKEFVDLTTYRDPIDEEWRWLFRPKAFRK